jgi:tRNA-modifying protein YgfZ
MTPTDYYALLTNKGLIQLSGEEKQKYLQGQITADVAQLNDDIALLACHCDFKGKTWSVSYLMSWQDSLLLLTHSSVLEKSLAELKKYGVFAKVSIADVSPDWQISAGFGHAIEAEITHVFGKLPEQHMHLVKHANGIVVAINTNIPRYLILQPQDAAQKISVDASKSSDDYWEIEDIKAGIAEVQAPTCNEFVPQMMNLQQLDAISFTKGCYMGQEVVARTKYLGKNKRAAFRLFSDTPQTVAVGDNLEYQIGENWRPAGTILRVGNSHNQCWLLAVLASDTEIGTIMRVKQHPQASFTVLPQPYELT